MNNNAPKRGPHANAGEKAKNFKPVQYESDNHKMLQIIEDFIEKT